MLNEKEIADTIDRKLLEKKQEMVDAYMAFQQNPNAQTFKEAENIPDRLFGIVADEVCKEVLSKVSKTVTITDPLKKTPF